MMRCVVARRGVEQQAREGRRAHGEAQFADRVDVELLFIKKSLRLGQTLRA